MTNAEQLDICNINNGTEHMWQARSKKTKRDGLNLEY